MPNLDRIYLYRITHIENIPHIIQNGFTHASSPNANHDFVPIGDRSLIATRHSFMLNNGRLLGAYIPFYFGPRTPMLFVVQRGYNAVAPTPPEHIVYCVSSVQKIVDLQLDFVFTDGHAVNRLSNQYLPESIEQIDTLVDFNAAYARYWNDENDLDRKRRKEAEFLILGDIPSTAINGYLTYNDSSRDRMIGFGIDANRVHVKPQFYF